MTDWQNRIIGEGEEAPDNLLANPLNWRIHPRYQQEALEGVLSRVGWVQRVIVNQRTGNLVDGHLRVQLAMRKNAPTVPVLYVDLSPEEEALILATLDPIAAMAATDRDKLRNVLEIANSDDARVQALVAQVAEKEGVVGIGGENELPKYTPKVEAPIYRPTGPCPALNDLADTAKAETLKREILAADIPDDVRAFLLLAAERHIVFDYRNIAEYYAHAPAEVQRLFENSALVIIDYDRAIELGYVRLTKRLFDLIEQASDD